mgnify:CR=1 FL=1
MNSKERVNATFEHFNPDRTPIFYLGFTPQWSKRVIGRYPRNMGDYIEVLNRFNGDICIAGPDLFYPMDPFMKGRKRDEWGRILEVCGYYCEFVEYPIKKYSDLSTYHLPEVNKDGRMEDIEFAKKEVGDHFPILSIMSGPFEASWGLRGLENFLIDLVSAPAFVEEVLELTVSFNIEIGYQMIEAGADIRYIQQLLRHKSFRTTQIYIRIANRDIKRLADLL